METTHLPSDRLAELPLWRLLMLLADVERDVGAASPTARVLARLIRERLRATPQASPAADRQGVARG